MTNGIRSIVVAAVLMAGVAVYASLAADNDTVLLSRNVLRTRAPQTSVSSAIGKVYRELRLDHFMDDSGHIRFEDGTTTDRTSNEWARRTGDFIQGQRSFDDVDGQPVRINWYTEPGLGTLVEWECTGSDVEQRIATILQVEIGRAMR